MFEKQQKKLLEQLLSNPKQLQSEVENIRTEASVGRVKVAVRGGQHVESVEIDGVAREDVKKAFNTALNQHKAVVNKKLRKMLLSGLRIPGFR